MQFWGWDFFTFVHTYWCVLTLFNAPIQANHSPELLYRCIIQLIQSKGWLEIWVRFMVNTYMAFLMCQELPICMFSHHTNQGITWLWTDFGMSRLFPRVWNWLMVKPRSLRSSWALESLLFSIVLYWLPLCGVWHVGEVTNIALVFHLYRVLVISTLLWRGHDKECADVKGNTRVNSTRAHGLH